MDKHRELERRYANYHYMPLPTREPDVPKRYIQDLISEDAFAKEFGVDLDPEHHPRLPVRQPGDDRPPRGGRGGELTYPEVTGVVELLTERGFTLDHRKTKGNIHFEEYW